MNKFLFATVGIAALLGVAAPASAADMAVKAAAAIQPDTAALFVLVRKVTADKVLERLKGEGGTALKNSLDHTKEAALQAALAAAVSA